MGYDCLTLGNHEFEYGWEKLLGCPTTGELSGPHANIFYEGTDINYGQSYTILEKEGLRIGLIGVMGEMAFPSNHPPSQCQGLGKFAPLFPSSSNG